MEESGALDLDAIEARAQAATPGPWELEREELSDDFSDEEQDGAFFSNIGPWEIQGHADLYVHAPDHDRVEADAAFMESAQPDVLALVTEVRRLCLEKGVLIDEHTTLEMKLSRAEEEAKLWRALAVARTRASLWPMNLSELSDDDFDKAHRDFRDVEAATAAIRAAGIDPDAP